MKSDHFISIELGGDPKAVEDLWPEPYSGKWGAKTKDTLEAEIGRRICLPARAADHIGINEAREAIATDWIAVYQKYVCGRTPKLTALMTEHCR